jgi:hypothetical protein
MIRINKDKDPIKKLFRAYVKWSFLLFVIFFLALLGIYLLLFGAFIFDVLYGQPFNQN